ncbi:uncharacterized protein Tco025E_05700 [Trypanosoma conorhini]|uniref:Uncharacterized protein n=1 Tax=Trypanosoma conorhini TaxID=83891 RepID=A0A3R7P0F7_9TRYP|nr:uncharacterized protein Tco025E_05700 [Trypanosoma conorhini]RNF15098.1 hypothetical protein Tco025E_05700 [Trypanosoma conorhini]
MCNVIYAGHSCSTTHSSWMETRGEEVTAERRLLRLYVLLPPLLWALSFFFFFMIGTFYVHSFPMRNGNWARCVTSASIVRLRGECAGVSKGVVGSSSLTRRSGR